jgi:hypothetical protein
LASSTPARELVTTPTELASTTGVIRRQRLGQHDRVVQLRNDHRRHQPHPIGPRGQRAHQRQCLRVVEGHALAPTQRRERAVVDHMGPLPQHGGIQVRLHDRHGHRYLHDGDSGMQTGRCPHIAAWQHV